MILVIALIGILLGAVLYGLSDIAPRYAASAAGTAGTPRISALSFMPVLVQFLAIRSKGSAPEGRPETSQSHSPSQVGRRWTPARQLAVEALSGLALAWLWGRFGMTAQFVFYSASFAFFLLLALVDIKYRLVLNIFTYPAFVIILLAQLFFAPQALRGVLLGGLLTFGMFFLTAYLRPGDLGSGDIKLATIIGIAFGFPNVLWALLIGAGLGGAVAVYLLLTRRGTRITIPYAPFLCAGAMVALLYNPLFARF